MTAAMIPLDDQKTETEALAARRPAHLPWNDWEALEVQPVDLALLRLRCLDNQLVLELPGAAPYRVAPSFLEGLGGETTFPPEFVGKLSPGLQAQILNERLDQTPPRMMSVVMSGETCVRFLPGDRAVLAAPAVADRIYDRLLARYGGVEIDEAKAYNGEHWLRLTTPFKKTLTGEVVTVERGRHEMLKDDVLALGVQVRHEFREGLQVELHVKRLLCYSSVTMAAYRYSWRLKEDRGEAAQLAWLDDVLEQLPDEFDRFLAGGRLMQAEKFEGHPRTALQAAAKAMKLPKRLLPGLFAAFDQEPGDNHYMVFNAITRMATHGDNLSLALRRELSRTAGEWATSFEMVNCRLPRPLAAAAGAQILAD
jgi:hypothetical protein